MKVAEYMIHFASFKKDTKRELLNEWAKVSVLMMMFNLNGINHSDFLNEESD